MSKLDGNERWKGKMLLTEHQEQYESRGDKPKGRATTEELALIRDAVLLPHALTMAQKGLDEIERSKIALHQAMAQFMRIMIERISAETFAARRQLRQRNIRVLADETSDDIIYHQFTCRGYTDKFGMTREVARAEIAKHISRTVAAIINPQRSDRDGSSSKAGEQK